MSNHRNALLAAGAVALTLAGGLAATAQEINMYTYREPALIQPILDEFTKATGVKVNVVFTEQGLIEKLRAEGASSPADMVLAVDVGRLNDLVEAGVVQPVRSPVLERNVPAEFRHPDGLWYGLSLRARVIYASKDRLPADAIASYEDLADPRFKGRLCTRSGKHDYNVSLIAAMIAHKGERGARDWLDGLKGNLARRPQGNDRAQVKAIKEGVCDVALVNTYYMGAMLTNDKEPEQKTWAEAVRIVFPNVADRGTHVNLSGAVITKSSKNRDQALRLLEFLSDEHAQRLYARLNFEYPVKPGVAPDPLVASWGTLKPDKLALEQVAKHRAAASRLVDETGFDRAGGGS